MSSPKHDSSPDPDAPGQPGRSGEGQSPSSEPRQPDRASLTTRDRDVPPPWLRTSAVVLGSVVLVVILLLVAAATLPTWWATTVGAQVDGIASAGTLWGLFYGALFTLLPLALVLVAVRVRWSWKVRLGLGAVAVVLLVPNLLTLAVSIGATERTREARTLLAIQAPNFRISTLVAVVVVLVIGAGLSLLLYRMTASRRELRELRGQAGAT